MPLFLAAAGYAAEEDWGEGLKVLTTYMPENCEYAAENDDVIHYHYVGRLGGTGEVFGRRWTYQLRPGIG